MEKDEELQEKDDFMAFTLEELEGTEEQFLTKMEAEKKIKELGISQLGKNAGEIMTILTKKGLFNILKFFHNTTYPLTFPN